MKKFILAITAFLALTVQASAMGYEQARQQALFLTDKMAYELNLTEQQYEAGLRRHMDAAQHRLQLRSLRLAVLCLLRSIILLPSHLLGCRLLAFRSLCPLSASHIPLLRSSYVLCGISRRPLVAAQRRTLVVSRTRLRPPQTSPRPPRYARRLQQGSLSQRMAHRHH